MSSPPSGPVAVHSGACFSSSECLAYLEARDDAPPAETFQQHLDTCERCRVLVAETARSAFPADGGMGGAASVRALADGELLGGRYRIQRFIARGGMGEVYEASDETLGERIALKTLSPTTLDQPHATTGLIAEVRLARKVMHPHVCRIFEFGVHRRARGDVEVIPFLTMELLDGETLARRVGRGGPMDPRDALRILHELADGLAAVHRAGIVHRDFKAENAFLVRATDAAPERAVVMDFGLARALDINRGTGLSSVRGLVGTVAYMAPEQVEGARPTPAFDVYALGTVAFEILSGRLPFVADSPLALATLRLRHEPPRLSSLRPELDPIWDAVIARCLAREPDRRFSSIEAVAEALREIGAGKSGAGLRFVRWVRRPSVVTTVAAAISVAGALVALRRRPDRPTPPATPAASVERAEQTEWLVRPPPPAAPVDIAAPTVTPPPAPPRRDVARRTRARPIPARPTAAAPPPAPAAPQDDDFIDPFSRSR